MSKTTRYSKGSFNECISKVKELATRKGPAYMDEVPEVLKEDFFEFIKGHTLSETAGGRTIVYDFPMYWDKLIYKGFDYSIKFDNSAEDLENALLRLEKTIKAS